MSMSRTSSRFGSGDDISFSDDEKAIFMRFDSSVSLHSAHSNDSDMCFVNDDIHFQPEKSHRMWKQNEESQILLESSSSKYVSAIYERKEEKEESINLLYHNLLMSSISDESVKTFRILLENYKAYINSFSISMFLRRAICTGNHEIIELLLKEMSCYVDPSLFVDKENHQNLFHYVCLFESSDVLRKFDDNEFILLELERCTETTSDCIHADRLKIVRFILDNVVFAAEDGIRLMKVLESCSQDQSIMQLFIERISSFDSKTKIRIFYFACKNSLIHLLPEIPTWNLDDMKDTLKVAIGTRDGSQIDGIFMLISGLKRIVGNAKCNQVAQIFERVQDIYGYHLHKHTNAKDSSPYDLSVDRRISYFSRCGFSKYSLASSVTEVSVSDFFPCNACIAKNVIKDRRIKYSYQIHQLWAIRFHEHGANCSSWKKAVDDNNDLLVVHYIAEDNAVFPDCIKYCLKSRSTQANRSLIKMLSKIFCRKAYECMHRSFDFIKFFLCTRAENESIIIDKMKKENTCARNKTSPIAVAIFHGNRENKFPSSFCCINIKWKSLSENREMDSNVLPIQQKQSHIVISAPEASELFRNHSNLNIISTSIFKKRKDDLIKVNCIVLYCWSKRYIPCGENPFPREINGVPTDIREGFCVFGSGSNLHIGGSIGTLRNGNVLKQGTAGGFLEKNGHTFVLSCAHVLYSETELFGGSNFQHFQYRVVSPTSHDLYGITKAFLFQQGNPKETGVDAALVAVDKDVTLSCTLAEENESKLRMSGFLPHTPPSFSSGEIIDIRRLKSHRHSVVKYGCQTGLTYGSLCLDGMHVRIDHVPLILHDPIDRMMQNEPVREVVDMTDVNMNFHTDETRVEYPRTATMYNQIQIDSHASHGCFFQVGDSGSLVFIPTDDGSLKCIGMAIGCTSHGTCIMTPITDILDQLDALIDPNKACEPLHFKVFKTQQQHSATNIWESTTRADVIGLAGDSSTHHLHSTQQQSGATSPDFFRVLSAFSQQMLESNAKMFSSFSQQIYESNAQIHQSIANLDKKIDTRTRSTEEKLLRQMDCNAKSTEEEIRRLDSRILSVSKQTNNSHLQQEENQITTKQTAKKSDTPSRSADKMPHTLPAVMNDSDSDL